MAPSAGARAAAQRRAPYIHLQHYTPPPRGARARTTHARTTHAPSPPPPPPRARARTRGITREEDKGGVSRAAVSSSSSDGGGYPVDNGVRRPSGSRPRRCVTPSARTHRLAPYLAVRAARCSQTLCSFGFAPACRLELETDSFFFRLNGEKKTKKNRGTPYDHSTVAAACCCVCWRLHYTHYSIARYIVRHRPQNIWHLEIM